MPNRQEKPLKKPRQRRSNSQFDDLYWMFDLHVYAKTERVVWISASPMGRMVVEDLWPDVVWTTDELSEVHSGEWLCTHIRVQQVPPHLETTVLSAFAGRDALGFDVARALSVCAWPLRVACWTLQGDELQIKHVR
jgi:hypothetical protein